jgi:hypothetical protein
MTVQVEGIVCGDGRHPFGEQPLDVSGNLHIENQPTAHTYEVVVMSLQILGKFERCLVPIGENLDHDPG